MIKKLFLVSFMVLALAGVAQAQDALVGGSTVENSSLGLVFVLIFFLIGILVFIFWVMMIVHAVKNPIENKVLWLLLILLTGIIGAIVYYFAVKRSYGATAMPMNNVPPSNPPTMPPSNMGQ